MCWRSAMRLVDADAGGIRKVVRVSGYRTVPQTTGFAMNRPPTRLMGFERETLLRYVRAWRQAFAMAA
jgi:hypothetical protein